MNGLREKFRNKKGFTLVEMLIVVAIIAILVAISIPMIGSALEQARLATDAANERSFKGALITSCLLKEADMATGDSVVAGKVYAYDAVNGKVMTGTTKKPSSGYGQSKGLENNVLWGMINEAGEVTMGWYAKDIDKSSATSIDQDNINKCVSSKVIDSASPAGGGSGG